MNIFCVGRITCGPTSAMLIENNIHFECYDIESGKVKSCNLELKSTVQYQLKDGQIILTEECFFFENQIVVVEGSYSRDISTFDVKRIYSGIYFSPS